MDDIEHIAFHGSGISPLAFGPAAWDLLSLVARNYPVHDVDATTIDKYNTFLIMLITDFLPCSNCRNNSIKHLKEIHYNPLVHLRNRQSFSRFVNAFHNLVNLSLGKIQYDFETHRTMFETKGRPSSFKDPNCS